MRAGARQPGSASVEPFGLEEPLALDIAHREVRQVELVDVPCVIDRYVAFNGIAKERQLKAEAAAVLGEQVAGVVPPLQFELRVGEVVSPELELVPGQRRSKLRLRADAEEQQCRQQLHSSCTASMGLSLAATRAGYSPASTLAR